MFTSPFRTVPRYCSPLLVALLFVGVSLSVRGESAPPDFSESYKDVRDGAVTIITRLAPGTDVKKLGQETVKFLTFLKKFTDSLSAQKFQPIRAIEFWQSYYERFNAVHKSVMETLARRGDGTYRSMGVVVGGNGLVLSNNASILCSTTVLGIEVSDAKQTVYSATVTAFDPFTNIALLKVYGASFNTVISITPAKDLPDPGTPIFSVQHCYWPKQTTPIPGTMGNSEFNGYGYQMWLDRAFHEEYFQAVMPMYDNSEGAPIFDLKGHLLGLLAFEYRAAQYPGIAFAVPAWMIADIGTDLIKYGKRERTSLGVRIAQKPLTVTEVYKGEAASRAGIQPGDVIETFNGAPVNTFWQLQYQIFRTRPHDAVLIGARRNNQPHQFLVHMDPLKLNSGK